MGACCSTPTWELPIEEWERTMISLEDRVLQLSGLSKDLYQAEFTTITMDNAPFKVRTIYINRDDRTKPTLLLTHGNMAMSIGYMRLLKLLADRYRVVAFDQMNLGLNTRSTDTSAHRSPEAAEAWIRDFLRKAVDGFELPDTFHMAGHSFGGYLTMMYASMHPERIDSIFLLSPAGSEIYNPDTHDPYSYISLADMERYETKKEVDDAMELREHKQHALSRVHGMCSPLKNLLLSLITGGAKAALRRGNNSEALIDVFTEYYQMMLGQPGQGDITMQVPFCVSDHVAASHDPKRSVGQSSLQIQYWYGIWYPRCVRFVYWWRDDLGDCKAKQRRKSESISSGRR